MIYSIRIILLLFTNNLHLKKKYVCYYRNFAIDKVGNMIKLGETGIAEGWNVPM